MPLRNLIMENTSTNGEKKLLGRQQFPNRFLFAIIAIFFLAYFPLLTKTSRYRGDERFYTDAAIRMVQTGDYLTPYYYDGRTRFRKPILVYWVLVAGYKILGISLFSSRIAFLIAGCLVVWLTYKISLSLFHSREKALAAAAVIASNFTIFHTSVRSTTDIFQCLFITVSLLGFINIIFNHNRSLANYTFAYLGAALAVATKGALGIFPVIFSFVFCFFRKRTGTKPRELIDTKIMVISAVVALFWFAAVISKHGDVAIKNFLADQVGERFSGSRLYVLENTFMYLSALVTELLPWSLIVLLALWRNTGTAKNFLKEHKEKCLFIIGWYLVLFLLFTGGNIQRTRYFLPAYPLISALFTALLLKIANEGRLSRFIRNIHLPILLAGLFGGAILILIGIFMDPRMILGGIILVFMIISLYLAFRQRAFVFGLVTISLFLITAFSLTDIFVRPVFYVSPAPRIVERVLKHKQEKVRLVSLGLPQRYVGQIRVLSGGRIDVESLPKNVEVEKLDQYPMIILSEFHKNRWDPKGYRLEEFGHSYKKWNPHYLANIKNTSDLSAVIDQMKRRYYLAVRTTLP